MAETKSEAPIVDVGLDCAHINELLDVLRASGYPKLTSLYTGAMLELEGIAEKTEDVLNKMAEKKAADEAKAKADAEAKAKADADAAAKKAEADAKAAAEPKKAEPIPPGSTPPMEPRYA